MPRQNLTSSLQTSARGKAFLSGFATQLSEFKQAAIDREVEAAKIATDTSRAAFTSKLSGRPLAPPRLGRPTTLGQFASYLQWDPNNSNQIVFDIAELRAAAPYALIQEIGTGQSAKILNPGGSVTVKSQRGRTISASLLWANGPGAIGGGPQSGIRSQQLYLATDLNNQSTRTRYRAGRIRREIKGKHFLQEGGAIGFRHLADSLMTDAERIFQ